MDLFIQRKKHPREKSAMNTGRSNPSFHLFILLALLASLLGSTVFVTPAHAAGITVSNGADTTADDGFCSLREAIDNANNDAQLYNSAGECAAGIGSDSISFDPSLSGATIYLGAALTLSSDVTIDGSTLASQITISGDSDNDGTGDVQAFSVNSGTVALNSLKITKGNAVTGAGAFNASGATLIISNSTFSG